MQYQHHVIQMLMLFVSLLVYLSRLLSYKHFIVSQHPHTYKKKQFMEINWIPQHLHHLTHVILRRSRVRVSGSNLGSVIRSAESQVWLGPASERDWVTQTFAGVTLSTPSLTPLRRVQAVTSRVPLPFGTDRWQLKSAVEDNCLLLHFRRWRAGKVWSRGKRQREGRKCARRLVSVYPFSTRSIYSSIHLSVYLSIYMSVHLAA